MNTNIDESLNSLIECHNQITKFYSETLLVDSASADTVDLLAQLVKERENLLDFVLSNLSKLDTIKQERLSELLNDILIDDKKIIAQASVTHSNIRKELAVRLSKNEKINIYKMNVPK